MQQRTPLLCSASPLLCLPPLGPLPLPQPCFSALCPLPTAAKRRIASLFPPYACTPRDLGSLVHMPAAPCGSTCTCPSRQPAGGGALARCSRTSRFHMMLSRTLQRIADAVAKLTVAAAKEGTPRLPWPAAQSQALVGGSLFAGPGRGSPPVPSACSSDSGSAGSGKCCT